MRTKATTVTEYVRELPPDRRELLQAVREVILANLPKGYEECMQCGMIGYVVPHSLYPAGYPCDPKLPLPYAALASQRQHVSLHLMTVYGDAATAQWFRQAVKAAGKRLDMGKCCVRFKRLADVPLDVIGQVIARVPPDKYIARFEAMLGRQSKKRRN